MYLLEIQVVSGTPHSNASAVVSLCISKLCPAFFKQKRVGTGPLARLILRVDACECEFKPHQKLSLFP